MMRHPAVRGFNCAAPFRGRLLGMTGYRPTAGWCFNCAAPFRGRLRCYPAAGASDPAVLQLCRPLPGAVTIPAVPAAAFDGLASIVPPPSGGGYCRGRSLHITGSMASIVPPPSGGGYSDKPPARRHGGAASIVPPPSGGGYRAAPITRASLNSLQLCRPLPGAVTYLVTEFIVP